LHLAEGWFAAGQEDVAVAHLDEVRGVLFAADDPAATARRQRLDLATGYLAALEPAPARFAFGRIEDLLRRLPVPADPFMTNAFFALDALRMVEAIVRAVIGDAARANPLTLRWMDEDEYHLRRRILRDVESALAGRTGATS
jgi:hypothetical protein